MRTPPPHSHPRKKITKTLTTQAPHSSERPKLLLVLLLLVLLPVLLVLLLPLVPLRTVAERLLASSSVLESLPTNHSDGSEFVAS